tara:strand:+ start:379 stop:936 length:558 start_codon:yes stop_codon:yes gene_type:complete
MRVQMGVLLCLCFTHLFFVIFFAAQRSNFMTVPTGKPIVMMFSFIRDKGISYLFSLFFSFLLFCFLYLKDCDQRDERLGWMGDANLSGDSMALNFNVLSFFKFYVQNIVSEINLKDGSLTDTVPFVRYGGRPGDVSWTGAFVNLMHVCDEIFNDQKLILQYLNQAVLNLNNIKTQAKKGLDQMHT